MAGLTITVGGSDITAYVDVHTISIEEVGTEVVATCRFRIRDHSGAVDIATKDAIDIDDDGVTIFAGEVAQVDDGQEGVTQTLLVICHDYNILIDETAIENESYAAGTADSAILADLFSTYRSDINAVTHVATLNASMEAVAFAGMTLREILDDLASRTGARYYVDYSKNLHWFATEANDAAFSLSTSPNMSTSFPFGGFQRVRSAARIADKVFVLGKEVSGWYPSGAPSYNGSARHAVSRDQRILTADAVEDRGKAIYDAYNSERVTYRLWTERDGLRAGQSVTVANATWSINGAYYIRRVRVEFVGADGETRRYHLELNDEGPDPGRARRQQQLQVSRLETEVNSVGDAVFDTDAPAAPTALGAGNVTTGVREDADGKQLVWAEITWSEVSDSDLDHYELQISTAADFSSDLATRLHQGGGDRRERFAGLVGNTTYYVRVRAVDWVGNTSAWDYGGGSPYSFTSSKDGTPPAQVAGLSAASSRTLAGLSWTAGSEADLRYYEIQRAPDSTGSPGAWATIAYAQLNFYIDQDFSDAQIAAPDTFWYRVRAIDTSGNNGAWATQTDVALGQIDSDHIAASAITADKIAANAVVAGKISAGAVTTDKLDAGAVTAVKINVSTLSAITANMGLLTAGEIRVGTGTVGVDFTGFRIMATYIGGYNGDLFQAGIRAIDGAFAAAGGAVVLDINGISLDATGAQDASIKWYDDTDGLISMIDNESGINLGEAYNKLDIQAFPGGGTKDNRIRLVAVNGDNDTTCFLTLRGEDASYIEMGFDADTPYKFYKTHIMVSHYFTGTEPIECVVYNNATQSSAQYAEEIINFNAEITDVHAMHSTAGNTERIVCVEAGSYAGILSVYFDSAPRDWALYIYWNDGGTVRHIAHSGGYTSMTGGTACSVPFYVPLMAVDDYVYATVKQSKVAGNIAAATAEDPGQCSMSVWRIT